VSAPPATPGPPPGQRIDIRAVRRAFARPLRADADVLAREVAQRMDERLELVRLEPTLIVDAGCGLADAGPLLRRRFPQARLLALDIVPERARERTPRTWMARVRAALREPAAARVCAQLAAIPVRDDGAGLLWSVLALNWAPDPLAALTEWHRVLQAGGLVMFAAYGPDTLKQLRAAFESTGEELRVHRFIDMHDLGDMLIAAGFADPVMETEWITLTYGRLEDLIEDLRGSGQTNALAARPRGLLSPRKWAAVRAAYEGARRDERLPATFEIVYGHAWKVPPRRPAGDTAVIRIDRSRSRRRGSAGSSSSA
jgi:malonyl-CoA O-methyltransferase